MRREKDLEEALSPSGKPVVYMENKSESTLDSLVG